MNDLTSPLKNPLDVLVTDLRPAPSRRQVAGHDRLEVTSRGRIWLILEGSVDLFLVDEHGRGPLFTVPAGQLIDSLPADPARIIAIPSSGTTVVETTREALLAATTRTSTEPVVRQAWNDWLQVLAALADDVATPLADLGGLEAAADAAASRAVARASAVTSASRSSTRRRSSRTSRAAIATRASTSGR